MDGKECMRYLSVCSGIEAASVAWHPLGWTPVAFSEIEPFPSAVLAHHFPDVPNLGDMTKHKEWSIEDGSVDLVCGGTPCQSFSVAGLRKGMDDPRGNLALVYLAMVDRLRPRWLVWENVPGVLSSSGGRDFGTFLGGLGQLGYGFAYRVLDAQYFGVPQRRRRVFVVGHLGDWRPAAAVLFERHSLQGHNPPSREKRQGVAGGIAPSLTGSGRGVARTGESRGQDPLVVCARMTAFGEYSTDGTASTVKRRDYKDATDFTGLLMKGSSSGGGRPLPAVAYAVRTANTGANGHGIAEDVAHTLDRAQGQAVQVQWASGGGKLENPTAQALRAGAEHNYQFVRAGSSVRRLTPIECERLQGFPDNWTYIPLRRRGNAMNALLWSKDGPRYKAIGNSMAVPVMRWIGERIQSLEAMKGGA
jgi:DNA (cytosine-5)-methyltransferase 1